MGVRYEKKHPVYRTTPKNRVWIMLCCDGVEFYNHEISVKDLRNLKETGRDGTSFQNLIELLENMGFKVKSFRFPKIDQMYITDKSSSHCIVGE